MPESHRQLLCGQQGRAVVHLHCLHIVCNGGAGEIQKLRLIVVPFCLLRLKTFKPGFSNGPALAVQGTGVFTVDSAPSRLFHKCTTKKWLPV